MTASRQKKKAWEKKFDADLAAEMKAVEDKWVHCYQAHLDGLTNADIAYMIGFSSASSIPAKIAKGKEILERRKGGSPTP